MKSIEENYRQSRQNLPYFMRALKIVNARKDCNSILDVGGGSAGFLDRVDLQYTRRMLVDPDCTPGGGCPNYICMDIDFMYLRIPDNQFDVVVCLQVMEHIDPAIRREFAAKLVQTAGKLLVVSIPYKWQGSKEVVDHNGLDEHNIAEWFGTKSFKFDIVGKAKQRRMVCVLDGPYLQRLKNEDRFTGRNGLRNGDDMNTYEKH